LLLSCITFSKGATDIELGLVSDGGPWKFYPAKEVNPDLPRVLLIGDSIMNGYRGQVISSLKNTANVDCWLTPKHLKSPKLHDALKNILERDVKYDVIHFNIGLHGWTPGRIPEGEYEPLMREYVAILKSHSDSVKIIWSSTTPITVKGKPKQLDPVNNPTIVKRNAIAARVMQDNNIPVNDLYALSIANLKFKRPDKYHWSRQGAALMGKEIAKKIKEQLPQTAADTEANKIKTIHLWPGKVPGETAKKAPAVSKKSGGVTRLSNVLDPVIEVFPAPKDKRNGAGVIICPGGGYRILAIDKEGYEVAEWLNTLGITAFVLQYRVPKKEKGALQDVQRALRIVKQQAKKWDIDSEKLGVMGFSAGGSLSARAATLYNSKSYAAADAADKLSCKPAFAILIYPAYLDRGPGKTITPELKLDSNTPPMFLFVAEDDPYAHSPHVMADALKAAQVPYEFHSVPKGGHGYGLRPGSKAAETWPPLAEKWLNKISK